MKTIKIENESGLQIINVSENSNITIESSEGVSCEDLKEGDCILINFPSYQSIAIFDKLLKNQIYYKILIDLDSGDYIQNNWFSKNYSFSKITIEEFQKCLQKFNFSYNFEKSKLEKYKFIPKYLEKFYYINQFGIISSKIYCDKWKQFPNSRNCFSSQENAKEFLKYIEKFYEL